MSQVDLVMILMIDNYDSFTFNLYHLCSSFVDSIQIVRNDKISLSEVADLKPKALILSPGPKSPKEAGVCVALIQQFAPYIPILGVCLGMQAIGSAFGAEVIRAPYPMHGKTSQVFHTGKDLFQDISQPMTVGRYHSLMIQKTFLPSTLIENAWTSEGLIMGVRHRDFSCFGVQFHPESILTKEGDLLIRNFFNLIG